MAASIITNGLEMYLDPTNPTSFPGRGTTITDVSGQGNHAFLEGGASFNNGAFVLNGQGQYLSTTYQPNLDDGTAFTWELWFWDDASGLTTGNSTALIGNYSSFTTPFVQLVVTASGTVRFSSRNTLNETTEFTTTQTVTDGIWHHIVAVGSATHQTLYIDGVEIDTRARQQGVVTSTQNVIIGGNHLDRFQTCRIGKVRLYRSVALSASEVSAHYTLERPLFGLSRNVQPGLRGFSSGNPANVIGRIQGNQDSGIYWVRPPSFSKPSFPVYIDFDNDGGAWVLIAKYGGHDKTVDKLFSKTPIDTTTSKTELLNPEFGGYGAYTRLSKEQMNSLWGISNNVLRVHFKNDDHTATSGVYFQSKITGTGGFDLWNGLANAAVWSEGSVEGTGDDRIATHGGTRWEATFAWANTNPTLANYNASVENSIYYDSTTHALTFNGTQRYTASVGYGMGAWDHPVNVQVPANGNETVVVTRHMGLFGDITTGNQWILTSNPSDSRFNANENRQSLVFLRCDTSTFTFQEPAASALVNVSVLPKGAWSLRHLLPEYTGPHVKIRRDSDDQTAYVWFGRQGEVLRVEDLATGALFYGNRGYQRWVGSDTIYVDTWYDQSSYDNHAVADTISSQPILDTYDNGLFALSQDDEDGQARYLMLSSQGGLLGSNADDFGLFTVAQMNYGSQSNAMRPYLQLGDSNAINMAFIINKTDGLGLDNDPPSETVETPTKAFAIGDSIVVASWERAGGNSNVGLFAQPPFTDNTATIAYKTYTGGELIETTTGYHRGTEQHYNTSKYSEIVLFDTDVTGSGGLGEELRQSMVRYARIPRVLGNAFAITLLDSAVTSSSKASCRAAFALRLVNKDYTGPVVRVRRSTDGALQDFFANPTGKLGIVYYGNGLGLETWLGGSATGFVVSWYDQSGHDNHATQSDTSLQATIQKSSSSEAYVLSFNENYMTFDGIGTSSIFHNTNYSVVMVERRQASGVPIYLMGTLTSSTNKGLHIGYRANGTFTHAQFSNDYDMNMPAYNTVDEPFRFWCYKHSSSSGKETLLNGVTLGTSSNTTPLSEPGQAALGTDHSGTLSYIGELAEVLVFNTDIAGNDISAIYTNQLAYVAPKTNTAIASTISTCVGAFGLRLLIPSYTGAVVKVRRGSDDATRDFYASRTGRLGDQARGRGGRLEDWLAGNVGYVDTWYDQTGTGNATQTTTGNQPLLVRDGTGYALQLTGGSVGLAISKANVLSIVTHVKLVSKSEPFQNIVNNADIGFRTRNNIIYGDTLAGSRFNSDFLAPSNSYWYINSQEGAMTGTAGDGSGTGFTGVNSHDNGTWQYFVAVRDRTPLSSLTSIGSSSITARSMQGLMSELLFFTSKLGASAANELYQKRAPFVDGTDLFSRLPSGMAATAVAAYATRLLNANYYGPCVQVRRSNDSETKDFFADVAGNLGDTYLGNGVSLTSWLAGATAYLVKWYDQSGEGNHATEMDDGGLDGPYGNPVLTRVGASGSRYTASFDSNPLQTPSNERYRGTMAIIYNTDITGDNGLDEAGSKNVIVAQNEDARSVLAVNRTRVGVRNGDDTSNEVVFSSAPGGSRLWILPDNPIRFGTIMGTTDEEARTRSFKGQVDVLIQYSQQYNTRERNSMRVALEQTFGRTQAFIGNTHTFGATVAEIFPRFPPVQTITPNTAKPTIQNVAGSANEHYYRFTHQGPVNGSTTANFTEYTITFHESTTTQILVVGGGGGGGCSIGSGGGAGGLVYISSYTFPAATYHIRVGAGGLQMQGTTDITTINGTDSVIHD
jgi:hypothetical protein